jgi:hypothetical protein
MPSIDEAILKDLPTVTREQALAFVEAIAGWEDIAEQQQRPNSPAALTHLKAILGENMVPASWSIQRYRQARYYVGKGFGSGTWDKEKAEGEARVVPLIRYLLAVALTLAEELKEVDSPDA